jgi:uncharacterized protein
MELETMLANRLFLDASYVIALAVTRDEHHAQALEIRAQIQSQDIRLITTLAVTLEIGTHCVVKSIAGPQLVCLRHCTTIKRSKSFPLARSFTEKDSSYMGTESTKIGVLRTAFHFLVMQERRLTDALTTDRHFEQAGFRALLRGM